MKEAFANEEEECQKFSIENNEVYKVGFKKSVWNALFEAVAYFFFFGSIAAILLVGGLLCKQGKLTVGGISYPSTFYMIQILFNFMSLSHVFGSVMSVRHFSY